MTRSFQRRLLVLLAAAAAGVSVWRSAPGSDIDRRAFITVVRSFIHPPLFITGQGTHDTPWKLRSFSSESTTDRRLAPVIVSLGDDSGGFFQASPPAPIDLAVVLTNFHRLGARMAATAAVLAWENPDPVGLAALEKSLGRFESLVMAAPLSRGTIASPLPPAFRRASIPLTSIHGDASSLPVVNRIPVPGVILGGENSLAGFSVLESEASEGPQPLLARWDDRVVFGFPLLAVLQRLKLSLADVEVWPGDCLKLGPDGPVVRIDRYGRLTATLKPISGTTEISAEALIDGSDELFPKQADGPVILRDDRSAVEPATRAFSQNLAALVAAIASDNDLSATRVYPRLAREWEIGILAALILLLSLVSGAGSFARYLGLLLLTSLCLAAQWTALGIASIWLPGLAGLAATSAAWIINLGFRRNPRTPAAAPEILPPPTPQVAKPKAKAPPKKARSRRK